MASSAPRICGFPNVLASSDIQKCYTPTSDEVAWVGKLTRGPETQLCRRKRLNEPPIADRIHAIRHG